MPIALDGDRLEVQLRHWTDELESKQESIRLFKSRGWTSTLECFLTVAEVEVIELRADLLAELTHIGIDVDVHFYADREP